LYIKVRGEVENAGRVPFQGFTEIRQNITIIFMNGESRYTLEMISSGLLGHNISEGQVSRSVKKLVKAI
ncbi:MAG: hypothetical protein NUV31_04650, partial [Dehalococcoidales bacterium]|nr:hypothetical protein [Dehalococcoidales bacterium]